MSTQPPATGPLWAYGPTANVVAPAAVTPKRATGWAVTEVLASAMLNAVLKNFGQWITYLNGPRAPYATLEGAAVAMNPGDTATIYEDDSATVPGEALDGYRASETFYAVAATSDVVALSNPLGTIYVFDRADPNGSPLRTMAPSSPAAVLAMTVYGDMLALASGNFVSMFRLSTGDLLWEYDHGGVVTDVQISGQWTVLVGDPGTGGFDGRLLATADGSQIDTISHGAGLLGCAIYGRQVAVVGAVGTGGKNARMYQIDVVPGLSLQWSIVVGGGGTINAVRTDGRNLYVAKPGFAYCYSWGDGALLSTADLDDGILSNQWLAVDQGGVYVQSSDGTTTSYLQRLSLGTLSRSWVNLSLSTLAVPTIGLATDGARLWTLNQTGGSADGLLTFARGNCPGTWVKIDTTVTTYQRFGWLLVPGVE